MKKCNLTFIICFIQLFAFSQTSQLALSEFENWLSTPKQNRTSIDNLQNVNTPLTLQDAEVARDMAAADYINNLEQQYGNDFDNGFIKVDDQATVRFVTKFFGNENPPGGRTLIISMHGGISTDGSKNDQQWTNQQALYNNFPNDYVYIVPRSPLNIWNGWHIWQTEKAFDVMISLAIEKYNINRNKVILVGYSAGGDGVYELSPRMGDVISASGMFAGTNNYSNPFNLHRVTWAGRIGENDNAFNRNQVMLDYAKDIQDLQNQYGGYIHDVALVPGREHWMFNEERAVFPLLFGANRDSFRDEIFWKQSGLREYTQQTFYNLHTDSYKYGYEVIVEFDKPTSSITVKKNDYTDGELFIYVRDENVNMDNDVTLIQNATTLFSGKVDRSIKNIWETSEKNEGDPDRIYYGKVAVKDQNDTTLNLAPDASVQTSSDFSSSFSSAKVNDRFTTNSGEWASQGEQTPTLRLEWSKEIVTNRITIYDRPNLADNVNSVNITFSDGSSLNHSNIDNSGKASVIDFAEKQVEWIEISITGTGPNVGLLEVEVFGNYSSTLSVTDLSLNNLAFTVNQLDGNQLLLEVKNLEGNFKNLNYSIYDMQGRIVFQSKKSDKQMIVDTNRFEQGVYLVLLEIDGKLMTKKIVVE